MKPMPVNTITQSECLSKLAGDFKILTHRHYYVMNASIYALTLFIIFLLVASYYLTHKKNGK